MPYDVKRLHSIYQEEADISDGDALVEVISATIETMVSVDHGCTAHLEDRYRKQLRVLRELMRRLRIEADLPVSLRCWAASQPSKMTSSVLRQAAEAVFEPLLLALDITHDSVEFERGSGTLTDAACRMLELMYEVFEPTGRWPTFQYISSRIWEELEADARELYLDLAERGLVDPPTSRRHEFNLREDTIIGVSLEGLMRLAVAADDIGHVIATVRYIAERAAKFRPASAIEPAQLTITDEEIRGHLKLQPADPALARVGTLLRQEAWQLQTSSSWGESGWSLTVNIERARRYRSISTIGDFLAISFPAQKEQHTASRQLAAVVQAVRAPASPREAQSSKRRVMVVHGRDPAAHDLFALLRALDLLPIEWANAVKQTGSTRPYTGEAVEAAFENAHAAVLLLVPEEKVTLRTDLRDPKADDDKPAWQPRPNVLYESGIAVTEHPQQTIVVELGRPRRPSDLEGIHAIRIDSKPQWRHEFAERLRAAGCDVNTTGTDWLEVGDFNEPELE